MRRTGTLIISSFIILLQIHMHDSQGVFTTCNYMAISLWIWSFHATLHAPQHEFKQFSWLAKREVISLYFPGALLAILLSILKCSCWNYVHSRLFLPEIKNNLNPTFKEFAVSLRQALFWGSLDVNKQLRWAHIAQGSGHVEHDFSKDNLSGKWKEIWRHGMKPVAVYDGQIRAKLKCFTD